MWRPVNLLYLAYFIKTTDYHRLIKSMRWVHAQHGKGYLALAGDILGCSVKYTTSFKEYFMYRFFNHDRATRGTYAGSGVMHRFTTQMNDRQRWDIFRSKALFYQHFGQLMGRQCLYLQESTPEAFAFADWIAERPLVVAKPNYGARGRSVAFVDTTRVRPEEIFATLLRKGQDFIEEPIRQHEALQKLNPSCVNTIRVITICTETEVDVIGTVMRLGVGGSQVDNMFTGGIAAPVDPATGQVYHAALSNAPWSPHYEVHPDTQEPILGFQVPLWGSVLELARCAARIVPGVRTVGWDIAVTSAGAILVEGNDNWNVALWQISTDEGQLEVLRRYADV